MKLGSYQKEVLEMCRGSAEAPLRALKGKASQYRGRYMASLKSLVRQGLLEQVAGPQGGKDWYLTTPLGEAALEA